MSGPEGGVEGTPPLCREGRKLPVYADDSRVSTSSCSSLSTSHVVPLFHTKQEHGAGHIFNFYILSSRLRVGVEMAACSKEARQTGEGQACSSPPGP